MAHLRRLNLQRRPPPSQRPRAALPLCVPLLPDSLKPQADLILTSPRFTTSSTRTAHATPGRPHPDSRNDVQGRDCRGARGAGGAHSGVCPLQGLLQLSRPPYGLRRDLGEEAKERVRLAFWGEGGTSLRAFFNDGRANKLELVGYKDGIEVRLGPALENERKWN